MFVMKQNENVKNEKRDWKKIGLTALAITGTVGTVGFGTLYCVRTKQFDRVMELAKKSVGQSEILLAAYEEKCYQANKTNETTELIKRVVGGQLIERLIKNEEKTLARFDNKIANIQNNGLDEISKKVLEDLFERRQNVIETIADFVDVRDVLKD